MVRREVVSVVGGRKHHTIAQLSLHTFNVKFFLFAVPLILVGVRMNLRCATNV